MTGQSGECSPVFYTTLLLSSSSISDAWKSELYSQHYQTSITNIFTKVSRPVVHHVRLFYSGISMQVPGFSVENNPFRTLYGRCWWWSAEYYNKSFNIKLDSTPGIVKYAVPTVAGSRSQSSFRSWFCFFILTFLVAYSNSGTYQPWSLSR